MVRKDQLVYRDAINKLEDVTSDVTIGAWDIETGDFAT